MPNSGNLTNKRKKSEKERNKKKRRKTLQIPWLCLIGKRTPDISKSKLNSKRLMLKGACLPLNGRMKKSTNEKWRDRSSLSIEKET